MYTEVAMKNNLRSLVAMIMTNVRTANSDFLISEKTLKSWRKEFDPVCFQRHTKMAISIMT